MKYRDGVLYENIWMGYYMKIYEWGIIHPTPHLQID